MTDYSALFKEKEKMKGNDEELIGKLKSIDDNFFKLEIDGKEWNIKYFTPWTKKDGSAKQGICPNEMQLGKTYKVMCSTWKKPEYDNPLYTAVTIFRQDIKEQPKTEGNGALINEFAQEFFKEDMTGVTEVDFILNYFASQFPKEVHALKESWKANQ